MDILAVSITGPAGVVQGNLVRMSLLSCTVQGSSAQHQLHVHACGGLPDKLGSGAAHPFVGPLAQAVDRLLSESPGLTRDGSSTSIMEEVCLMGKACVSL